MYCIELLFELCCVDQVTNCFTVGMCDGLFTKLIVLTKGRFSHVTGKGLNSYTLITLAMYPKVFVELK